MPTIDLRGFLIDTDITLDGIPSQKHPKGKSYLFPSPSAKTGKWLYDLVHAGITAQASGDSSALSGLQLDDEQEIDLYRDVMGTTLQKLLDDGVNWATVQQVFGLLLRQYAGLEEASQAVSRSTQSEAARIVLEKARVAAQPSRERTAVTRQPAKKAAAKKAAPKRAPAKKTATTAKTPS